MNSKKISLLFVSLCTLVLFAAGCGDTTPSGRAPVIASSLVSVAEIEKIIGATVEQPPKIVFQENKKQGTWMSMCGYFAPEPGISVSLMVQPFASQEKTPERACEEYLKSLKANVPGYEASFVEDLGVKAVWHAESGQLTMFHESRMYLITVFMKKAAEGDQLSTAKKIATAVLAKKN